ncbi:MAG: SH3 domain-containing protein [Chloroflexota bacterium]
MLNGLFTFIWQVRASAPTPEQLVTRMQQAHFGAAVIKVVDGTRSYPIRPQDESRLRDSIVALRGAQLNVWGWGAFYGETAANPQPPEQQAQKAVERIQQYGLTGFALDVENFNGTRWSVDWATRFMNTLQVGLAGQPVDLALCSYRFPRLHGSFPLAAFAAGCSLIMPQVYWIRSNPVADLDESLRQYAALAPGKPYLPMGIAAPSDDGLWQPTPEEMIAFLDESRRRGLPAYGFWSLQHAFANPTLWQTLVNYPQGRPRNDPVQPADDAAPQAGDTQFSVDAIRGTGVVTGSTVNYRDLPSVRNGAIRGQLHTGDVITIVAKSESSDSENPTWYQFTLNGQDYWISAAWVTLNPIISASNDPMENRLRARVSVEQIRLSPPALQDLVELLESSHLSLRGLWSAQQIDDLAAELNILKQHGISLETSGGTSDTGWTANEVRLMSDAVLTLADHARRAFAAHYTVAISDQDSAFCFRVLYAPVQLSRINVDNIAPDASRTWWAVNDNGYHIRYGNKVFVQTRQQIVTQGGLAFPKFTPKDLAMHELAHNLGYRRRLVSGLVAYSFEHDLTQHTLSGQVVPLPGFTGLLARAGSSDDSTEIIADLVVCAAQDKFTISTAARQFSAQEDREGQARRAQAAVLMSEMIEQRVRNFHLEMIAAGPQPALDFVQAFAAADTARCQQLGVSVPTP